MARRNVYLKDIPLEEAWRRFEEALAQAGLDRPFSGEEVPLPEALGRVTAAPVWARISSPHFHAAAMDGYALRARDTAGATETRPVRLALVSPDDAPQEAPARSPDHPTPSSLPPAQPVNTGQPLPPWADAVVMIEHVQHLDAQGEPLTSDEGAAFIEIRAAVAPWQHVRPVGEDMVVTELVLPANHRLRPVDLGAIAGCGHTTVLVRRKPRVAIIPTGNELVPAGTEPRPGQVIEYNSLVLAAQVTEWGGEATRWPIVPDDEAVIRRAVLEAARDHDLVLVNAGSSAGSRDYTARVVASLGQLLVHGIAVRPGHPVILGTIALPEEDTEPARTVPIIGVPGYPASAALTGEIFVQPLLARWLGQPPPRKPSLQATITRKVLSPMGDEEYLRVAVGRVGDRVVAAPLARGAGVITSLVRADGIVRIPRFSEGLNAGDPVTVELYVPPDTVERTIVAIGSHDLSLDLLAQHLAERSPGLRLSSANAGSLGGLIALRRGECHLAGSHLLDPESGEYNWPYVRRYLPDLPVVLVTLVRREQGLIVAPGNPLGITGLADLARPEVRFVNRQRGAGTRVLLDYHLERLGIAPEQVRGYRREEITHLAVAVAVASGVADCGLGIRAAAQALGLDFVPVAWERYDLVIPRTFYEEARAGGLLAPLLDLLHDDRFRQAIAALPGYDPTPMGEEPTAQAG